ncbi:hypothetical protein F7725_010828 [Dissostichus mawsoni]|uniref:Uncharacterized protein n=1 Tax=Dissostichus mawsoni TaxID=36200 RepID=A0A7J5ZAF2_DISMA|nr:hypothetical protein F7725_010828 [Dissostichus mawsoni]
MLKDIANMERSIPADLKGQVDAMVSRLDDVKVEVDAHISGLDALQDTEFNKLVDRVDVAKIDDSKSLADDAIKRLPGINATIQQAVSNNAETSGILGDQTLDATDNLTSELEDGRTLENEAEQTDDLRLMMTEGMMKERGSEGERKRTGSDSFGSNVVLRGGAASPVEGAGQEVGGGSQPAVPPRSDRPWVRACSGSTDGLSSSGRRDDIIKRRRRRKKMKRRRKMKSRGSLTSALSSDWMMRTMHLLWIILKVKLMTPLVLSRASEH